MSKRLFAVNLLLAAVALLSAVELSRVLSAPRPLPPPAAPLAPQAAGSPKTEPAPSRPSLAAYSVVATRNLFNPNRTEGVTTASLAPAAKPVLHGIVINGETRLAYFEDPTTKRVFGYKTGDTVAGGQLERIEDDRVVIRRPDGLLEVKLKDPSKPKPFAPTPPRPGAPPAARPPAVMPPRSATPPAPGVARPRPPQQESGTQEAPAPTQ